VVACVAAKEDKAARRHSCESADVAGKVLRLMINETLASKWSTYTRDVEDVQASVLEKVARFETSNLK
jgi:hypothetical protein